MEIIRVDHLSKIFELKSGLFFSREKMTKKAVDDISFSINQGEIVGYIGPNGAGKSTTIKMLTGILEPSSGEILVSNRNPFAEREKNAMQIGVLFGQRTQLWWDLPLMDTLNLHKHMYRMTDKDYEERLRTLSDMLDLYEFKNIPIRQLSLGQRMRCELAVTLLHGPSILYLDEPTIGMDVIVKERIRNYLFEINKQFKVTILLTTHDLLDVEKICNRIIVINHGKLLFDGTIEKLKQEFVPDSTVTLKFSGELSEKLKKQLNNYKEIENGYVTFTINRNKNGFSIFSELCKINSIIDLKISEPPIEEIIKKLYDVKEEISL